MTRCIPNLAAAAAALALAWPPLAAAHTGAGHAPRATTAPAEQKPWGIAGRANDVRRTVQIRMGDDMRFTPDRLEITEGETVRLRVANAGGVLHELVIGTRQELEEHAALMRKHPNMEHDEPYMAHVAPGRTGSLVWNFNRPGEFDFACLIPGHFEAGMMGRITVRPRNPGK